MWQSESEDGGGLAGECVLCGREQELFRLPGTGGRFCLACSADLATVLLLKEEIDAATLNGRDAEGLIEELSEVSAAVLARSQSTDFGSLQR